LGGGGGAVRGRVGVRGVHESVCSACVTSRPNIALVPVESNEAVEADAGTQREKR
jgi:hypothetical protein